MFDDMDREDVDSNGANPWLLLEDARQTISALDITIDVLEYKIFRYERFIAQKLGISQDTVSEFVCTDDDIGVDSSEYSVPPDVAKGEADERG